MSFSNEQNILQPLGNSTKNWHWRTKPVEAWSKDWFDKELTGLEVEGVSIDEVKDVEGDAEVGMRKSKLVTIFDQKLTMVWKATSTGGEEVKGTLICLEVSHDMDEDDYVFTSSLDSVSNKESEAFNLIAKKKLANKLRPIFQKYPKAMLDTHGKDLLTDVESTPNSGASTPIPSAAAPTPSTAITTKSSSAGATTLNTPASIPASANPKEVKAKFNTATVKADAELSCTAEDLFDFLTNESKIPLWSRNPAIMSPTVDSPMRLFGGNIEGKVLSVSAPTNLKTTWRAPTWPEGYYGTLEMELRQGSSSTNLGLRLSGVPVGKEDEAERNLNIYYIQGLKQIGSVIPPFSSSSSSSSSSKSSSSSSRNPPLPPKPSRLSLILTSAIPITISLGIMGALVAAFYYGPSGPGGKKVV